MKEHIKLEGYLEEVEGQYGKYKRLILVLDDGIEKPIKGLTSVDVQLLERYSKKNKFKI